MVDLLAELSCDRPRRIPARFNDQWSAVPNLPRVLVKQPNARRSDRCNHLFDDVLLAVASAEVPTREHLP